MLRDAVSDELFQRGVLVPATRGQLEDDDQTQDPDGQLDAGTPCHAGARRVLADPRPQVLVAQPTGTPVTVHSGMRGHRQQVDEPAELPHVLDLSRGTSRRRRDVEAVVVGPAAPGEGVQVPVRHPGRGNRPRLPEDVDAAVRDLGGLLPPEVLDPWLVAPLEDEVGQASVCPRAHRSTVGPIRQPADEPPGLLNGSVGQFLGGHRPEAVQVPDRPGMGAADARRGSGPSRAAGRSSWRSRAARGADVRLVLLLPRRRGNGDAVHPAVGGPAWLRSNVPEEARPYSDDHPHQEPDRREELG